jgi:hypothetical protein
MRVLYLYSSEEACSYVHNAGSFLLISTFPHTGIVVCLTPDICLPTGGTRWRSWLRHCVTNRKVAGSITDGVTGIFQ